MPEIYQPKSKQPGLIPRSPVQLSEVSERMSVLARPPIRVRDRELQGVADEFSRGLEEDVYPKLNRRLHLESLEKEEVSPATAKGIGALQALENAVRDAAFDRQRIGEVMQHLTSATYIEPIRKALHSCGGDDHFAKHIDRAVESVRRLAVEREFDLSAYKPMPKTLEAKFASHIEVLNWTAEALDDRRATKINMALPDLRDASRRAEAGEQGVRLSEATRAVVGYWFTPDVLEQMEATLKAQPTTAPKQPIADLRRAGERIRLRSEAIYEVGEALDVAVMMMRDRVAGLTGLMQANRDQSVKMEIKTALAEWSKAVGDLRQMVSNYDAKQPLDLDPMLEYIANCHAGKLRAFRQVMLNHQGDSGLLTLTLDKLAAQVEKLQAKQQTVEA